VDVVRNVVEAYEASTEVSVEEIEAAEAWARESAANAIADLS
jgi:hypothetical protein